MCTCLSTYRSPSMTTRSRPTPDLPSEWAKGRRSVASASNSSSEPASGRATGGAVTSLSIIDRRHVGQQRCRPPTAAPHAVAGDAAVAIELEDVGLAGGVRHAVLEPRHRELDDLAAGDRV